MKNSVGGAGEGRGKGVCEGGQVMQGVCRLCKRTVCVWLGCAGWEWVEDTECGLGIQGRVRVYKDVVRAYKDVVRVYKVCLRYTE